MMSGHRVACVIVTASLLTGAQSAYAQAGWPDAKTAATAPAPKAAPAPKTATADVKKPAPVVVKSEAASVAVEPQSVLQSLTTLLARQTVAIEALLRRLDASESKMSSLTPTAVTPEDLAYVEPMPVVVAVAAGNDAMTTTAKPLGEAAALSPSAAPAAQIAPRPAAPRAPAPSTFSRWGDLQQFNLLMRYRFIENSAGVPTNDQVQSRTEFKGRFKLDRAGHYALNAGIFTGAASISGWNNTGAGTGDPTHDLNVKQFYFAAAPVSGLELQYGGIYVNRGEGTQITTYDNDLYLTGQRVTVKRPNQLWFDEVSATQAYLGDPKLPSVWDRLHRLNESNYYQLLVGKKVGMRMGVSADYTSADDVSTWRSAFALKAPELTVVDGVRVETYARLEPGPTPFGWALTLDKKVGRTAMSGGFASIDEYYGGLNGDDWGRGDRWFGKATANIFQTLAVTGFYTYALDAGYPIVNKERFDLIFIYDVLKTFAPAARR